MTGGRRSLALAAAAFGLALLVVLLTGLGVVDAAQGARMPRVVVGFATSVSLSTASAALWRAGRRTQRTVAVEDAAARMLVAAARLTAARQGDPGSAPSPF